MFLLFYFLIYKLLRFLKYFLKIIFIVFGKNAIISKYYFLKIIFIVFGKNAIISKYYLFKNNKFMFLFFLIEYFTSKCYYLY
jgi:hypothetical protein